MVSVVKTLHPDGTFGPDRIYTIAPEHAVVCAARQDLKDFNTWNYPTPEALGVKDGTYPGSKILLQGEVFYGAYPQE